MVSVSRIMTVCAVAIILAGSTAARADSFDKAKDLITAQAPNLNYASLCSESPGGEDKIGCRLKAYPDVGFLVCKQPSYDGASCQEVIRSEIDNLSAVKKAGLKTVTFKTEILGPVKCAGNASKDCYGYLAAWVTDGQFHNIDDAILQNSGVAVLADQLVKYIRPSNYATTRSDLAAIQRFMTPGGGKYSRICDLQGFFLKTGGFLISDVPQLVLNSTATGQDAPRDCGATSQSGSPSPTYNAAYQGIGALEAAIK